MQLCCSHPRIILARASFCFFRISNSLVICARRWEFSLNPETPFSVDEGLFLNTCETDSIRTRSQAASRASPSLPNQLGRPVHSAILQPTENSSSQLDGQLHYEDCEQIQLQEIITSPSRRLKCSVSYNRIAISCDKLAITAPTSG